MKCLLRRLGHPETGLNFIHIAGTNGKGSVAAALDSIFREAGFRPGLYTSPHLVDFRERIRVGGKMVGTRVLQKNMEGLIRVLKKIPAGERPTFFEATTALALQIFREERVDFVVWETGLGGRLDATNVILPELCLLTSLGRDHEEILGRGWTRIGGEKAGILKKGVPVFSVPWPVGAFRVLRMRARKLRCPLRVVRPLPMAIRRPGFHGQHQRWNLSLAREAGRYLGFPEAWIRRGLARASWPGRFQVLQSHPRLVLDGAHNPEGVRAALRAWRDRFGKPPGRIIFGCLRDKPVHEMLREMKKNGVKIWGVNLPDPRGSDPLSWPIYPHRLFSRVLDALEADRLEPVPQGTLVMGSLVLAGEVLRIRGWRPV